jgi:hypothetical protein
MAVIIPQDATFDVRRSFEQVNDELRGLQKENARLLEQLNIREGDIEKVSRDLEKSKSAPSFLDFNDIFRGAGGAHAIGHVPDPGLSPRPEGFERYLRGDGDWRAGIAPFFMPGDRHARINLPGHTHVAGALSCSKLTCGGDVFFKRQAIYLSFASDQEITTSGTQQDLLWDGPPAYDNAGMFDSDNPDRITIKDVGLYHVGCHGMWEGHATGQRALFLSLNDPAPATGSAILADDQLIATVQSGNSPRTGKSTIRFLVTNDVLRVSAHQTSTVALDVFGTGTNGPRSNGFWCYKVSD